ncbi:ABC transporter ATP-binding protein [Pseudovibrio exalbescens]|uniref:ABC transporter ATP-binding protein n=1 Tax=Pseudovibrio exalbescens TaxID=197461 RepID=UPI0023667A3C|nr:ABC transporter ATP-binding protein [Pseudovibrio exalbescens]MDD7910055.1 ABC transporter ATP-binding protein [Pseudovibrio exalbescens]
MTISLDNQSVREASTHGVAAIELKGINKSFGPVHANKDIDLVVGKGSIHGIVGENGAGKSTLMSILYGFYTADTGDIIVDGKTVKIPDSKTAIEVGIGMVHQHFMLVDPFTVVENVMLGAEGGAMLSEGIARVRKELGRLADEYDMKIDLDAVVGELPVGLQQRVEILKALYRGADILILDEPTGVLTPAEADHLFRILRVLRDEGKTILLITHKLREIMDVTDQVSVMRRGEMVASRKTAETSMSELAELMVGRSVLLEVNKQPAQPKDALLKVANLNVKDDRGVMRVKNVSLEVKAGEILGIAGVSGNGQSELLKALSGITRAETGSMELVGNTIDLTKNHSSSDFRELGMSHVPEDRHRMGLVNAFSEYENSILGYHREQKYSNGMLLNVSGIREEAKERMEKYDIRPRDTELKAAKFSGGNQQKIVLAREIECDPDVLLIGQPTRGVDIGAIEYIHKRIIEMRDAGKAVLLVSVELDEIRSLADRILVMFDGNVVGERGPDATEQELGLLMAGVTDEAAE